MLGEDGYEDIISELGSLFCYIEFLDEWKGDYFDDMGIVVMIFDE